MQVQAVDPLGLPPEHVAVVFARFSRTSQPLEDVVAEVTDEAARRFHERWVLGFGHASVAEHACVHLHIRGVSRWVTEFFQRHRLASHTERSTRYQALNRSSVHVPEEVEAAGYDALKTFQEAMDVLFAAYDEAMTRLVPLMRRLHPDRPEKFQLARALDAARFLLPNATTTLMGTTVNARELAHILRSLRSIPLAEARTLADRIEAATRPVLPTLLRYTDPYPIQKRRWEQRLRTWKRLGDDVPGLDEQARFGYMARLHSLWKPDPGTWGHLYHQHYSLALDVPPHASPTLQPGPHEPLEREYELFQFLFDLVTDQGAFYELKRHRTMTPYPEIPNPYRGWAMPAVIEEVGMTRLYDEAIRAASQAYERLFNITQNLLVAAYVLPQAMYRRLYLHANARSLHHFLRLRLRGNAHPTMRITAALILKAVREHLPHLFTEMEVDEQEMLAWVLPSQARRGNAMPASQPTPEV